MEQSAFRDESAFQRRARWLQRPVHTMIVPLLVIGCSVPQEPENQQNAVVPASPLEKAAAPAEGSCSAQELTGRDYAVRETIVLRISPAPNAAPIPKSGSTASSQDALVEASIDESIPVREICRKNGWSRVQVLVPEYLRWMKGWAPSSALVAVPVTKQGRRTYRAADVEWQPGSERYKRQIVSVLNHIAAGDARCDAIDTSSLLVEEGLRFTISCVGPSGTFPISFSAADAGVPSKFIVAAPSAAREGDEAPVAKVEAIQRCEEAISQKLSQPKSADFHTFTDTTFSTDGSRARVTIGFSARNGLGNSMDATAECVFEGSQLVSAAVI